MERLPEDYAAVPADWWFEIRNILIANEIRSVSSKQSSRYMLVRRGADDT